MPFRKLNKISKNNDGATMIEFAFAAPVIILLSFGFFQFCHILFTQAILDFSAAEATRYAMVNFDEGNIDDAYIYEIKLAIRTAAEESFTLIDNSKVTDFDVVVVTDPSDMTKTVGVTIQYNYALMIPFLPFSTIVLRGSSESFLVQ